MATVATAVTGAGPTTQLHLPISAQMLNATPGLATLVPTLQQLGPLRVIPSDGRQIIAVQSSGPTNGTNCGTNEGRPVALVVHSTTANNDNRVTFVHSTSNDGRPLTFVPSTDARPIVFATQHASPISEFFFFEATTCLPSILLFLQLLIFMEFFFSMHGRINLFVKIKNIRDSQMKLVNQFSTSQIRLNGGFWKL